MGVVEIGIETLNAVLVFLGFGGALLYYAKFKAYVKRIRAIIDAVDDALYDDSITEAEFRRIYRAATNAMDESSGITESDVQDAVALKGADNEPTNSTSNRIGFYPEYDYKLSSDNRYFEYRNNIWTGYIVSTDGTRENTVTGVVTLPDGTTKLI